jgi:ADP-heptose:LPS heptosyltransferase
MIARKATGEEKGDSTMMDSEFLRSLDKKLGQPVCFLFSLLNLFKRKNRDIRVKNILVLELFEMGAAVMAYPAIRCLRKNCPQANIYCLCTDSVKEAWEVLNVVPGDHILAVESKGLFRFGVSLLSCIVQLRKIKIDLLIDLGLFMRIASIIAFLSGAKLTAGFNRYEMEGLYRGNCYDYPVAFNQNTHIAKNFLALVLTAINKTNDGPNFKCGIDLRDHEFPRYRSDSGISAGVKRKLSEAYPDYQRQPIILVCPDVGGNLPVRNYPQELYAIAIKKILLNNPESLVVLIGTVENRETCDRIAKEVGHRQCIDFSGQTATLTELLELFQLAVLLIGNDNGPLHLASMTPCKILGLFSAESPFLYGPLGNCVVLYQFYQCSPCLSAYNHKHTRCTDNRCLKTLHPDLVSDYALGLLEDKVSYRTCNNRVPYLF